MKVNRRISATRFVVTAALLAMAADTQAQSSLFQVELNDSTKLFKVNSDGGFVALGTNAFTDIPAQGAGTRFMWYSGKYALRAGQVSGTQWDDGSVGLHSVAFGKNTQASGSYSVALGNESEARGAGSIAAGEKSFARGNNSLAVGEGAAANQSGTVALGIRTAANGNAAFAAGEGTNAIGQWSVALGRQVTAQGDGSFIFGDANTSYHRPAQPNQFVVRAFGGILLNTGAFIGCELAHNSGTWSCASSRTVKEGFEDTDGEEILSKVAGLSIKRWRYIGSEVEHIGPIAEEFRQAFGLGTDSTKIDGVDADGVALRAIQALERRTAILQAVNVALEADNVAMRSELVALRTRIAALEQQHRLRTTPDDGGAR
jgi:hypothetical protein